MRSYSRHLVLRDLMYRYYYVYALANLMVNMVNVMCVIAVIKMKPSAVQLICLVNYI